MRRGSFSFRDADSKKQPGIALSRVEMAVENLATRPELTEGRPATASLSAVLGESGDLSGFVSADLFAKQLNIAGNMALRGWQVKELYELEKANAGVHTPEGTLDLFTEQAFGPAFGRVFMAAIETLVGAGYPPEAVLLELYESELRKTRIAPE